MALLFLYAFLTNRFHVDRKGVVPSLTAAPFQNQMLNPEAKIEASTHDNNCANFC